MLSLLPRGRGLQTSIHYPQRKGTRTHHRCVPRPPRYTICRFSQETVARTRSVRLATVALESEVAAPATLEATMPEDAPRPAQAAIRPALGAIFVSLELSRRTWLITSLSPGGGEKMSKHSVPAGEVSGLLRRFAEFRRKAAARHGTIKLRLLLT